MPRRYRYIDFKSKRVLFETTQPNHVSEDAVNEMFKKATGRDYRLERGVIDRDIRMVEESD